MRFECDHDKAGSLTREQAQHRVRPIGGTRSTYRSILEFCRAPD
jgi:hypothetical protein